ncbi:MAG TPA: hypothetical protein VK550_16220 [Polyangiaceae bacterium]|nr:hypothetical protein [Polyangiaceae bacterium]
MDETEIRLLETGSIKARVRFTAEEWEEISFEFSERFPNGTAHVESDGSVLVEKILTAEELEAVVLALPPEREEGDAVPMGFWPKAHWYCVKVWTRQGGHRFVCQKSIYESPLWAWARAAGIGFRKAGKDAEVNMSRDRCSGDQNSCHV